MFNALIAAAKTAAREFAREFRRQRYLSRRLADLRSTNPF